MEQQADQGGVGVQDTDCALDLDFPIVHEVPCTPDCPCTTDPGSAQRQQWRQKSLANMSQEERQIVFTTLTPNGQAAMIATMHGIDPAATFTLDGATVPQLSPIPKGTAVVVPSPKQQTIQTEQSTVVKEPTAPHKAASPAQTKVTSPQGSATKGKNEAGKPFGVLDQLCASRRKDSDKSDTAASTRVPPAVVSAPYSTPGAGIVKPGFFSKLPWLCSTPDCNQPNDHDGVCDPDMRQGPRKRKPKHIEDVNDNPVHPPPVRAPAPRKAVPEKKAQPRERTQNRPQNTTPERALCGVISTRGVACKQAHDVCPYHRKKQQKVRKLSAPTDSVAQPKETAAEIKPATANVSKANNSKAKSQEQVGVSASAVPKFSY